MDNNLNWNEWDGTDHPHQEPEFLIGKQVYVKFDNHSSIHGPVSTRILSWKKEGTLANITSYAIHVE